MGPLTSSDARPRTYRYRAFISYSHKTDRAFAKLLQGALERLGKPWYRRHALAVFRDDTDLAIDPQLWPRIEAGLAESEFLLLLANPVSAASAGVRREVRYWTEVLNRDSRNVLIALTGGEIVWDETSADFDWARTRLPEEMKSWFIGKPEPLWADFRECTSPRTTAEDVVFREPALKVAAALHGVRPRDLESADLREHRRTIRTFAALVVTLIALLAVIGLLYLDVRYQRNEAEQRARIATSRALAVQAMDRTDKGADLALLLSVASHGAADTVESRKALLSNLLANPYLSRFIAGGHASVALLHHPSKPLIAGASEHSVWVRDLLSNEAPVDLGRPDEDYKALRFSPDGAALFAVTAEGKLVRWDWQKTHKRTSEHAPKAIGAPSGRLGEPAGDILAASTPFGIVVWATGRPSLLAVIPAQGEVDAIATSPAGNLVAVARHGQIHLWDIATGAYRPTPLKGHAGRVQAMAFSGDGHRILSGAMDESVILWDLDDGRVAGSWVKQGGWIASTAISPDGRYLAWGGNSGTIKVFDLTTEGFLPIVRNGMPNDAAGTLAFSPDSRTLVAGSRIYGSLVEFELMRENAVAVVTATDRAGITGVAVSADGKRAYTASRGEVSVWNVEGKSRLGGSRITTPLGGCFKLSPNGKVLAACSSEGKLLLWNVEGDTLVPSATLTGENAPIKAVAYADAGSSLVAGDERGQLLEWNLVEARGDPPRRLASIGCPVSALAVEPNGKRIGVGCGREAHLLDRTGKSLHTLRGDTDRIVGIAFDAAGNRLIVAAEDGMTAWDLGTLKRLRGPLAVRSSRLMAFDASVEGALAVSASRDGWLGLWDTGTGGSLGQVQSSGNAIFSVALGPGGRLVVAGGGSEYTRKETLVFVDMDPSSWARLACRMAGRDFAADERGRYLDGEAAKRPTCS